MIFRQARHGDLPAIAALLAEDRLGAGPPATADALRAAFEAMAAEGRTLAILGEERGRVVACDQLTILTGLSLTAPVRGHLEAVRVAASEQNRGIGAALLADAGKKARRPGFPFPPRHGQANRRPC